MTEEAGASPSPKDGQEVISHLWFEVIKVVNRLLEADLKFGFSKIEASLNPSIDEILHGLGIVDYALTAFMDSNLLEHDDTRAALNSKQCVLHIRGLAAALKGGNEEEYKAAIHLLNTQPKF